MRSALISLGALILSASTSVSFAQTSAPDDTFSDEIMIRGFVSQGFILSSHNNFSAHSTEGSTEFTEVGFNLNKQLSSKLRAAFQLFTRDLGRSGNYDAKFDWFLLDYRLRDEVGFRAGRIKIPLGFHNDTMDIETARAAILLPQSVYPYADRDYLMAQTGFEVYGIATSSILGALSYRFYRGNLDFDVETSMPGAPYQLNHFDTKYVFGGRLIWEPPVEGLRIGTSAQRLQVDSQFLFLSDSTTVDIALPVTIAIGSLEYSVSDFELTFEYSRWWLELESSNQARLPNLSAPSERYYAMVNYILNSDTTVGGYFSVYYPNMNVKTAKENVQNDLAMYARYDLSPNWILKGEAHAIDGTAGLSAALNEGRPASALERRWGMFLLKTTVLF